MNTKVNNVCIYIRYISVTTFIVGYIILLYDRYKPENLCNSSNGNQPGCPSISCISCISAMKCCKRIPSIRIVRSNRVNILSRHPHLGWSSTADREDTLDRQMVTTSGWTWQQLPRIPKNLSRNRGGNIAIFCIKDIPRAWDTDVYTKCVYTLCKIANPRKIELLFNNSVNN